MSDTRPKATDVDAYIAMQPEAIRERLIQLRSLVKEMAPDAKEVISYAIPAYLLGAYPVIYFAAYDKHVGIYPLPKPLPEGLEPYVAGKGTLRFANDKPLPVELIREAIRARLMGAP